MSETRTRTRTSRRAAGTSTVRTSDAPLGPTVARLKTAEEIAALLHLAELDAAFLAREDEGRAPVYDEVVDERHGLGARLSPEILEAYDRALRARAASRRWSAWSRASVAAATCGCMRRSTRRSAGAGGSPPALTAFAWCSTRPGSPHEAARTTRGAVTRGGH